MLIYIFKTVACMAILLLFYKLLLEKENMHVFKRFYLLLALGFSLVVPAVVFTEYVEVTPFTIQEFAAYQPALISEGAIGVPEALDSDVLDIAPLLWIIYFIGLTFFGLRFIKNLKQISRRIHKNPKEKVLKFTNVLLQEIIPPHTFFNYIFLNKKKFESDEIPKEVLLHEETHAQQKHSIDVVIVELLHVIFWINPFLYFIKKSIKLNHEFLADQAVLKNNFDKTTYQNTLLSYLSPDSEKKYQPLANAINYSSIKKRFTIMKTHTSKKAVLFRSLLLLPMLALLLYGFSEKKVLAVEKETKLTNFKEEVNYTPNEQITIAQNIIIHINKEGRLLVQDDLVAMKHLKKYLSNINQDLTKEQKQKTVKSIIYTAADAPKIIIDKVDQILTDYGSATVDIIGPNPQLNINRKASKVELNQYNSLAKKYNAISIDKRKIPFSDLKVLETVFRKMTQVQKSEAQPFPECLPNKSQDGASRKLMAEYDALAKKYNSMLSESKSIQIKMKDVERLEYIHGLMSDKQKADAQPFPDFPPMPAPPKAPKASKVLKVKKSNIPPPPPAPDHEEMEKREEIEEREEREEIELMEREALLQKQEAKLVEREILMEKEEANMQKQEIALQQQEIRMSEQEILREELESKLEEVEENGKRFSIKTPPAPPAPKPPLDHVIEMAKKNAKFYYEGKEISSDKAIDILKKNKDINIDSRSANGKRPIVKLSTEPIVIEN